MVEEIKIGGVALKDLEGAQIRIGEVIDEDEEWEPMGPNPKPGMADLRNWDFKLMERYKAFYAPYCEMCCFCTFGKCDLTGNKKGACGLRMDAQQARFVVIACLIGCSAHCGHSRHMLHDLEEKFGKDYPIDFGESIEIEAPLTRLIMGIKPKVLSDFEQVLSYIEEQVVQVMDSTHTGQEGAAIDYESKAFHLGMLDSLGKEVGDIIQQVCFKYPMGGDVPLVDLGMSCVDPEKPLILVIGHNVVPSAAIIDNMIEQGYEDKIEIGGICCTAHDNTRYYAKAKIIGSIGRQLRFIRSGAADVIVVDEQCIRADVLEQAKIIKAPLIATNDKAMYGLPDRTDDPADEIIDDLVNGRADGVVILKPDKVGEVVPKLAVLMREKRKGIVTLPSDEEFAEMVKSCMNCDANCVIACPQGLPIGAANQAAAEGNMEPLLELFDLCVGCGRCEQVCKQGIPIVDVMQKAALPYVRAEKTKCRVGRGPILDTEIRNVGAPLVLGTIPGIVAIVGCSNYSNGTEDVYKIAKEFVERKYIVVMSGCGAMDISLYKDEDGKSLYEKYPGDFDGGCILNVGSCVSNAHIHGAAIKVAAIFARRQLRGNYEEIADYILNRVGACGVAWGAMSQKAASIASGVNRLGIPVMVGPHGWKYRRAYLGRKDKSEDWNIIDARDGSTLGIEPAPEHLLMACDTVEEAIPEIARLCMRPTDNALGRQIKMTHYLDLCKKYLGKYSDDWPIFIRNEADLPLANKEELMKVLESDFGWKIDWAKKKILEGPIRKSDVSLDATNLPRLARNKKE